MQRQIQGKRIKFAKQIRKDQINSYMAECRSKIIQIRKENTNEQKLAFLDHMLPTHCSYFQKIKGLLEQMFRQEKGDMKQEGRLNAEVGNNAQDKLKSYASSAKGSKFCFLYKNQSIQIEERQLCDCFNILSKEIYSKVIELNKVLLRLTRVGIAHENQRNMIENLIKVNKNTKDLKDIACYCNCFLKTFAYLQTSTPPRTINEQLLEEVTSCLIELSCFRQRHYQNSLNLPEVDDLNTSMKYFRDIINKDTSEGLISLAKEVTSRKLNIKILTNIIYIFGNIFVSLSSHQSEGKELYSQSHEIIFHIFQFLLKIHGQKQQLMTDMSIEDELPQLWSLIVWFIRNQVLIIEGLFNVRQSDNSRNQSPKKYDQRWIDISFTILKRILTYQGQNLSQMAAKTICDIISLFKLLKNDFNLHPKFMWIIFQCVQPLELIPSMKKHHCELYDRVIEFYIDLLDIPYKREEQLVFKDGKKMNPHAIIYEKAHNLMLQPTLTASAVKLYRKIVDLEYAIYNKGKLTQFQVISDNFEQLLQKSLQIEDYDLTREFLELSHLIIRLSELNYNKTEMKPQFFSLDLAKNILKLCEKIWEMQKDSQDIITSLQLLKTISQIDYFSNYLKEAILNQGYFQQLQNLSAHVSQDINRLVYEIYELLELE